MSHHRLLLGVGSVSHLCDDETLAIAQRFRRLGFVVIRPGIGSSHRRDVLALSPIFGRSVGHVLASDDGVVVIEPRTDLARFGTAFTNARLEIHTDGAFYADPPKVVAMQCETCPPSGGATCLVDGARLYRHVVRHANGDIGALFALDAMTIARADECASQPIFRREGERILVSFRLDDAVDVTFSPDVERLLDLIRSFLEAPRNQIRFQLSPGDIVVLDNRRILHGRDAFSAATTRRINRVWFDGHGSHGLEFGFRVPRRRPRARGRAMDLMTA